MRLENEIRTKYPASARAADYEQSRSKAIRLQCLTCMGGSLSEVKSCPDQTCFLWPYRAKNTCTDRESGVIPTLDAYNEATAISDDEAAVLRDRMMKARIK